MNRVILRDKKQPVWPKHWFVTTDKYKLVYRQLHESSGLEVRVSTLLPAQESADAARAIRWFSSARYRKPRVNWQPCNEFGNPTS